MAVKAFISYSRRDVDYAERLAAHLRSRGMDAWFDREILYSAKWWQAIVDEIRAADAVVLVMTPALDEAEYVVREVLLARRESKPIFPLLLAGDGFPLVIDIQHVDVSTGGMPPDDFVQALSALQAPVQADRSDIQLDAVVHELERLEETLAAADRAVAAGRADARIHTVRARALNELLRPQEALTAAEAPLQIGPDDRDALFEKCDAVLGLGEDADALAIAELLLRKEPGSVRAMAMRGSASLGDDPLESLRWADRALVVDPHQRDALALRGWALALAGRTVEAAKAADTAIAAHPGFGVGYACKVAALLFGGEHEEASTLLDSLCLIYPDSDGLQGLQAAALLIAGDYDRAERASRRAIELNPRRIGSYESLASILSVRDRPQDALATLEQAERMLRDPPGSQDAGMFGAKALLLRTLGRPDEARAAAERGHVLDDTASKPLLSMALLAIDDGEPDEALRLLDRAFRRDPVDAARIAYEEAARFLERNAVSASLLLDDELVARGHSSPLVQFRRGQALWRLGRPPEAVAAFDRGEREAARLGDDYRTFRVTLLDCAASLLSAHLQRHDDARQALMRAHELDPKNAEILVSLADVSRRAGSREESDRYLAKALETDADGSAALAAAETLLRGERYGESLQLLDAGVVRWAATAHFHTLRGRCLDRLGRTEEAVAAIRRAEQLLPPTSRDERALLVEHQGALLRQLGRPKDAALAFQKARELAPTNVGPLLGLTLLALDDDDLDGAGRHAAEIVQLHPDDRTDEVVTVAESLIDADAYEPGLDLLDHLSAYGESAFLANWLRARSLSHLGRLREALAALGQAERDCPAEPSAQLAAVVEAQGNTLHSLGKHAQARAALQRALDLDPSGPGPLVSLAMLALDEGDPRTAVQNALRLLDTDGNQELDLLRIAQRLEESGHVNESLTVIDRMVAGDLGANQALFLRWKCLTALARTSEAASAILDLADALPAEAQVQRLAAGLLMAEGRAEPASRCAERALVLNREDAEALQLKAEALIALGQPADSLRVIERSIELDDTSANAYFTLTRVLVALGRHAEAQTAYEAGLDARSQAEGP